jgi:signal transduction histidine kinase
LLQDRLLLKDRFDSVRRLASGPNSLQGSLALTVAGLLLIAILVLAISAVGLLRKQADQQALVRTQLAGVAAREELRRVEEDAQTSARLLAARPTLVRLVRDGNQEQLELFLRRYCSTAGLNACAVTAGPSVVLASTRPGFDWAALLEAVSEQGEHFMFAPPEVAGGLIGATAQIPNLVETRVVVLRFLDDRLAAKLTEAAGIEVRLVRLSKWLDGVDPALKSVHSTALTTGAPAAERIPAAGVFASSTPVVASTGEGVALIESRLPIAGVDATVDGFVKRLAWTALVLGMVAVLVAWLLARRIVRPLELLASAAKRLGRGDFSTSIPESGGPETAALGRTLEGMRRNLVETTATLRQREAEAQAMLRGVVEGVFAVDADRVVRYLNPQAERMAGVASSEALGRFCGDVLKPCVGKDGRRPCETACPILAARERDQAQATEFMDRPDGSKRTVIITSARMVDGLQVQVMRDETALESARRARDSILANISHEFRTPLAAQLASLELLEDNLQELPREQLRELVSTLKRGTLRLTRLIDNLLESVRIESGQLGIRSQPVSLEEVVREAGELVEGLLSQRGQSLEVTLPHDLPEVLGDAPRLTQVFVNLLANANKFGPEGGPIRIGGELAGAEVRIWVEDVGPGVADPEQGSIFERFYRAADSEPEPRGLGLGLWIVKSIVERHGGRVAAERTPAGRTRFTITLPVAGAGR